MIHYFFPRDSFASMTGEASWQVPESQTDSPAQWMCERTGMKHVVFHLCLAALFSMTATVAAQDSPDSLFKEGNSAYSKSDYVSASYYFNRIRESENWDTYPKKVDLLSRLATIEERQSRYDTAAKFYAQMIDLVPKMIGSKKNSLRHYYLTRHANSLERSGLYRTANKIYWQGYHESEKAYQLTLLKHILRNMSYQQLTDRDIAPVRKRILPALVNELGWDLADLYRVQGMVLKSFELMETLWPMDGVQNINDALQTSRVRASGIVEVYTRLKHLDDLIERMRAARAERSSPIPLLLLEIAILEDADRGGEALKTLESFLLKTVGVSSREQVSIEDLTALVPGLLLDRWIDLVSQIRGNNEGIRILQDRVEMLPMDLPQRKRLSGLLLSEGREEEAVQQWTAWAETQKNTPLAVLNAAEEIYSLGEKSAASELLSRLTERIPPSLAIKQGNVALRMGDYEQAFAAYEVAAASGGIQPLVLSMSVLRNAGTIVDRKPLVAYLIQAASGRAYQTIPVWIKHPLMQLGVSGRLKNELKSLIRYDSSGVWLIHLSKEALKQGDRTWARELLEAVPEKSVHRASAEQTLALFLSDDRSPVHRSRAAEMLLPSVAMVLDASKSIPLNRTLTDRLLQYAELCLDAFEPAKAFTAIRKIESSSPTLKQPIIGAMKDRLSMARARALVQYSAFQPALDILNTIGHDPYFSDAQFLMTQIQIARGDLEIARSLLHELADRDRAWSRVNDALSLLVALEPLVGDSLSLFSDAMIYQLQGRLNDAIPPLRQLAVEQYGNDAEEWARFRIGVIKKKSGDIDAAREEWRRLLLDVDNPIIHGMTRYELVSVGIAAGEAVANGTDFQELLLEFPDSIYSDLARQEIRQAAYKE